VPDDLIDRIYEAALIPEAWPGALERMSRPSGSASGTLFVFSERFSPRGVSTDMTSDLLESFLQSDVWRSSPSVRWTLGTRPGAFSSVDDHLSKEQSAADEAWAPLAARGFGRRLVTVTPLSSGEQVAFVLARMRDKGGYRPGEITALNRLRPHLNRATLIAARLGLERANAMTETLARIGLAAAVIDSSGRVVGSNALLETLPAVIRPTAFGGIRIGERESDARFGGAIRQIGKGGAWTGLSIPVPAAGDGSHPPLIIHLLPVCGAMHDIFTGGQALMVVSLLQRKAAPLPEMLHGLFDLSPAEARLVGELAVGMTLREITTARGVSMATLRTQVRAVLAKTGVPRLVDLSQLLAQIPHQLGGTDSLLKRHGP
jgi:DNA-binding CsgD family transcriptional regulator